MLASGEAGGFGGAFCSLGAVAFTVAIPGAVSAVDVAGGGLDVVHAVLGCGGALAGGERGGALTSGCACVVGGRIGAV